MITKTKNITTKTKPEKILKYFRECGVNGSVNLKIPTGFIYLVGGVLNKLEGTKHSVAIKGKWVEL